MKNKSGIGSANISSMSAVSEERELTIVNTVKADITGIHVC
ncbi:hypothetical protein UYSO10_4736 [Kosakonia radicincitans]|nr:hypothetical protein UYSO10_4736 [Kosakonia radicincitans]